MAEGGGLLNRYRGLNPYRGFESHPLRHFNAIFNGALCGAEAGRSQCLLWPCLWLHPIPGAGPWSLPRPVLLVRAFGARQLRYISVVLTEAWPNWTGRS